MDSAQKAALKQATLDLIARVNEIHLAGTGELLLGDLLEQAGFSAASNYTSQRGAITFRANGAQNGCFGNEGDCLNFAASGLAIEVPSKLEGEYEISESRITLRFSPQYTVTGRKLFARVALATVVGGDFGIDVELSGPIPIPATHIRFD